MRAELLRVPSVAKVDLIGEQEQRIYVELSTAGWRPSGSTCRR
jgi:multidrug efflux pump subunit AcrB